MKRPVMAIYAAALLTPAIVYLPVTKQAAELWGDFPAVAAATVLSVLAAIAVATVLAVLFASDEDIKEF